MHKKSLRFLSLTLLFLAPALPLLAEEDAESKASGPWISCVTWIDGDQLAATKMDGSLHFRPASIVQAAANEPASLKQIGASDSSLWSLHSIGNGQFITSDYQGGIHRVGPAETKKLEADTRWVRAIAATPDAGLLAAGTDDGQLVTLSLDENKETGRIEAGKAQIFDIAFHPSGNQVATAGGDGVIRLFSWPELKPQGSMSRGNEAIWTLEYLGDGSQIVSGGADRRVQLWDVAKAESIVTITRSSDWVTDLVVLPNSNVIVAACMDGNLIIADATSLSLVESHPVASSALWSIELSPDGKRIAAGTRKDGIQVLDVPDWIAAAKRVEEQRAQERPPTP